VPVRANQRLLLDRGLVTFLGTLLLASTWMWWSTLQFGDPFGVKWLPPKTATPENCPRWANHEAKAFQANEGSGNPTSQAATAIPATEGPSQVFPSLSGAFGLSAPPSVPEELPDSSRASPPPHLPSLPSPSQTGSPSAKATNHQGRGAHTTNTETLRSEEWQGSPLPPVPDMGWQFRQSWFGLEWRRESPWFRALRSADEPPESPVSPEGTNSPLGSIASRSSPQKGGYSSIAATEGDLQVENSDSTSEGALRLRLPAGRFSQSRPAE